MSTPFKASVITCIGMASVLVAHSAWASAAAVAIGAAASMKQKQSYEQEDSVIPMPGVRNDGFVEALSFYREGPAFRICDSEARGVISVKDGQCTAAKRVRKGFMDHQTVHEVIPSFGVQEHLDRLFGRGVTEFTGASTRRVAGNDRLVIFYKITDGGE